MHCGVVDILRAYRRGAGGARRMWGEQAVFALFLLAGGAMIGETGL